MYRNLVLILILVVPALAAGPNVISYQGYLQDIDGGTIAGPVNLQMGVWNDPVSTSNSSLLYLEDHFGVAVDNGLFSVPLGGGSTVLGTFDAELFGETNRWLEIRVNGEPLGPRTQFLSVPYSFQAQQAESLSGLSGAVMHFALPQCPPGWSELTDARGRTIIGLPENGTLSGVSGVPMSDLATRQHNHMVTTTPLATSAFASHSHSVGSHSTTTDTHNHRWTRWNGTLKDWISWNFSGGEFTITNWNDGMDQAGSGIYPIAASSSGTTTIYTDQDSHSHSINSLNTGSSGGHAHNVPSSTVSTGTAGSDPTLPYIQLLTCIKN